ncbi:MAG: glycosyltransferase family 4 protein, partial [Anaerolineae bacterium]
EGWLTESFYAFLERYPYKDRVLRLGFVQESELPALYAGAAVTVQPSLYEGFGLPVLEAMACGSAVSASRISSLPEVGGDAVTYFDPLSSEEMSTQIRAILEDDEFAHHLRNASLLRSAQFTWDATARQTVQVYEQLLK